MKPSKPLRIAITKGRLEKDTLALFERINFDCKSLKNKRRKLIFSIPGENIQILTVKADDVITYVERGVCDIGIVGKDTIMESGHSFYEVMNLGFGNCRFALAGPKNSDFYGGYNSKRIATKYPNVARSFFESKGMDVEIIKIEGSVELAPMLGLSDAIVDIVETGTTLRENDLEVIEEICPISARMIINIVSMKLKKAEIDDLCARIDRARGID
jgi:ATP phosphoribosyltransferase